MRPEGGLVLYTTPIYEIICVSHTSTQLAITRSAVRTTIVNVAITSENKNFIEQNNEKTTKDSNFLCTGWKNSFAS